MIDFPSSPTEYPNLIFLDTLKNNLVKPYQYVIDDAGNEHIGLIGIKLVGGIIQQTIPESEFTTERFTPIVSVAELRALIEHFKTLDSNQFFKGSFPVSSVEES